MQVDVHKVNSYKRQLKVKIDPSELKEVEDKAVRKIRKDVSIRGFRKGKAPLNLIKQRYAESIKLEVMESAISDFYTRALNEVNINPISPGNINNLTFDNIESGMEFDIEVEVEPEIELKKYKGLKVEKEIPVVTDKMKEQVLSNLREQYATAQELEEVKEGSHVIFDAQLLGDGDVPVIGRKFEDVQVKVGSGEFDPELEQSLIGVQKDQQKIIRKTVEARSQEQNSKTESYQITIKSIQEKELPPLDDDFVQNLQDDSIQTLEQLKERIHLNLKQDVERRSQEQFISRLIDELLKENPFEAPASMVDHYLDHWVEDIKKQFKGEKIDESTIRQNYRARAIHNVRWYLIKGAIAEQENIQVEEKEIDELIDKMNVEEKQKKELKTNSRFLGRLREDLLEQKVINLLASNADIVEVYPTENPESSNV